MTTALEVRPDHNSLGKAAFIIGLIALVISFVPLIGMVAWILAPLAILFGIIACFRSKRSLAIAGIVTGALALVVCFGWVGLTKSVGEAVNKNTFNATGEAVSKAEAPILDADVKQIWTDLKDNKVGAGQKYGSSRLRFVDTIKDFGGDVSTPRLLFEGGRDDYLVYSVSATFTAQDGEQIAQLKKGDTVEFVCDSIQESFGEGYGLGGCKLQ